jgi:uncharacterized protein YndB with AHSA1/START domain
MICMAHISTSVEIARSPEEVFAFISDVSRHPEWQEGLLSAAAETEGPLQVGSRVVHRRKLGPTTMATTSEITAFDPPHLVAFRELDGPIRAEGTERLEPAGEGSRVSFEMEMRGHGVGVLMLPMVRRQVTRQVVESHEKLKLMLEAP